MILCFDILENVSHLVHLLLGLLNFLLTCVHRLLPFCNLSLQVLNLNLDQRSELSVQLVDTLAFQLVFLVPLFDLLVTHDFLSRDRLVCLVAFLEHTPSMHT